jgi:hypothetical protein
MFDFVDLDYNYLDSLEKKRNEMEKKNFLFFSNFIPRYGFNGTEFPNAFVRLSDDCAESGIPPAPKPAVS